MSAKIYDLEERTFLFAKSCSMLIKDLTNTIVTIEDGKQLVRSSGSVITNYIVANEKLGDKDFLFSLKLARKEAKESNYWLQLLKATTKNSPEFDILIPEVEKLRKIV